MECLKIDSKNKFALDCWKDYFYYTWRKRISRAKFLYVAVIVDTALYAIGILTNQGFFTGLANALTFGLTCGIVFLILEFLFSRFRYWKNMNQFADEKRDFQFCYDDVGIKYIYNNGLTFDLKWAYFKSYSFNKKYIYLWGESNRSPEVLISEALSGEYHYSNLKKLIEANLKQTLPQGFPY